MIFVTLGTHTQPMDRLMVALDEIATSGEVDDEIIVTAAEYRLRPTHVKALGIQPYSALLEWTESARAVITHGGPASILMALGAGHSPIVIPRDPAFSEHVDDHQIRFAAWLEQRRNVTVVRDVGQLKRALLNTLARNEHGAPTRHQPVEAIARLRGIIEHGAMR